MILKTIVIVAFIIFMFFLGIAIGVMMVISLMREAEKDGYSDPLHNDDYRYSADDYDLISV